LNALVNSESSTACVSDAIALLRSLDPLQLPTSEQSRLLAPDADGHLRPVSQLFYDNLGARRHLFIPPDNQYKVHPKLDQELAAAIGVPFLSSLTLKRLDLGQNEGMHEDVGTRISNTLLQYTIEQAFNELLANACDAGATNFGMLLDERSHSQENLLSENMVELQGPGLIVHNDATFSSDDFVGIRRVGIGGKRSMPNTIGRFGLGSLSLFHFADVSRVFRFMHS
jgi:hypothetical protein